MVKRYSDTARVKIQSGGVSNPNLGRIDPRPLNTMLDSVRNLADNVQKTAVQLGKNEAEKLGRERGLAVNIEYKNGVPVIPAYEVNAGPIYENAYRDAVESVYKTTLQQDIRTKINEARFTHDSSDQRNNPENLAEAIASIRSGVLETVDPKYFNLARNAIEQFGTTTLSDVRERTARLNYNNTVKGLENTIAQISDSIVDDNITMEDFNNSEYFKEFENVSKQYLQITNGNMAFIESYNEKIQSALAGNSFKRQLFGVTNGVPNLKDSDLHKVSMMLTGAVSEEETIEIAGQEYNRSNIVELIPDADIRTKLSSQINTVINQKNKGSTEALELSKSFKGILDNLTETIATGSSDQDALTAITNAENEIENTYNKLDLSNSTPTIQTTIENTFLKYNNSLQKLRNTHLSNITKKNIDNRNALLEIDLKEAVGNSNPILIKDNAQTLVDNGISKYKALSELQPEKIAIYNSLINDLGAVDDKGELLANKSTFDKINLIANNLYQKPTIMINGTNYDVKELSEVLPAFVDSGVYSTQISSLDNAATASSTTVKKSVQDLLNTIPDNGILDENAIYSMSLANSSVYNEAIRYIVNGGNDQLISTMISDNQEDIAKKFIAFEIIGQTKRIPSDIINFMKNSRISGDRNSIIQASNLFGLLSQSTDIKNVLYETNNFKSDYTFYETMNQLPDSITEDDITKIRELTQDPDNNNVRTILLNINQNINSDSKKTSSTSSSELISDTSEFLIAGYRKDIKGDNIKLSKMDKYQIAETKKFLRLHAIKKSIGVVEDIDSSSIKDSYKQHMDFVLDNKISFEDGSSVIFGHSSKSNYPMDNLSIDLRAVNYSPHNNFKAIYDVQGMLQSKTDGKYRPKNFLPNIHIVQLFKQAGGVDVRGEEISAQETENYSYLDETIPQIHEPHLGIINETSAKNLLSIDNKPLLLGVNAGLVEMDGQYALARKIDNGPLEPVLDKDNEIVLIPGNVVFNNNLKSNLYHTAITADKNASIITEKVKGFIGAKDVRYKKGHEGLRFNFDNVNIENNGESYLIGLNRFYLTSSIIRNNIEEPIEYEVKKFNRNFYVVPTQTPIVSDNKLLLKDVPEREHNYMMYPVFDTKEKAESVLQNITNITKNDTKKYIEFRNSRNR